ncbi:rhodanese-like domain-containing protein [Halobacillus sp. A5]|uniref:rhodanese-like domain-containing protein n=1 Tax=Halobacillus sp. A5 TaxID=2880263 RepID=UPI0020A6ADAA|nr:rhodanese-like domain-containing protein [Halobacillus sp. A5]MCP3028317.1 rhodanese-like domain-containing protein [Halobacillus sp. A5]
MSVVKVITPEELQKALDENKDLKIIDVRENEEVAQGMIPSAQHIPLGNVPEEAGNLDPENEYVMVCRSGRRSMNASEFLKEKGFHRVHNLEGGMLEWKGELVF